MGSGALIRSLLPHHLIDEFMLVIQPLILGSGQRLFPAEGDLTRLRMVESVTTSKGVIIATYHAAADPSGQPAGTGAAARVETA